MSAPWPPDDAELLCEFTVLGTPKTAGSKQSFIPRRGDGSMVTRADGEPMVVTKDDAGEAGEAWRQDVGKTALGARPPGGPIDGPVALELTFYRARNKGHYRTGRFAHLLRDAAPLWPTTRPDALKLARAVEDALSSVVWLDDSQVIDGRQRKLFGTPERCEVRIWRLPATMACVEPEGQESLAVDSSG